MTEAPRRAYSSPKRFARLGYLLILVTFGGLGSWAAMAKIDSATIAPGTVVLENHRQMVQHLEGGIVREIHVKEGDTVEAGARLVVLEAVEARAEAERLRRRLNEALAVQARLETERRFDDSIEFAPALVAAAEGTDFAETLRAQTEILADRLSIFTSQSDIMRSRIEQLKQQVDGLVEQEVALERRVALRNELIDRLTRGEAQGLIETNLLAERRDVLIQIEADLGEVRSETARIRASIGESELNLIQLRQEFLSRANLELEEVRARVSETQDSLTVAEDILTRKTILSPAAGSVQNISVTTIGAVVRPGDVLMEVVPLDDNLIVTARVSPIDIDNVVAGQEAMVRFSAFNSQKYPIIIGNVESVSDDVILPRNNQEQPYFLARIRVPEDNLPDEILLHLTAGMPADVVIVNGERTVLNYLVAPLENAIALSLREK